MNQPVASSVNSLPGYQKTSTNQQQAHVNASPYQTGRATVDSVAERLAAHVQQEAAVGWVAIIQSCGKLYIIKLFQLQTRRTQQLQF